MVEELLKFKVNTSVALIIGASSRIAQAIIAQLLEADDKRQIIAVSRQQSELVDQRLHWLQTSYDEDAIATLCAELNSNGTLVLQSVFICNGILHDEFLKPERALSDFDPANYSKVHHVNALIPMLWLKHLKPFQTPI